MNEIFFLYSTCCTVYFTQWHKMQRTYWLHIRNKLLATHFVNVSFGTNYNEKTKHNEKRGTREHNLIIFQHYQISISITQ